VAPDDLGKVIGKKGRTAKAMRTLLAAAALNTDARLEIVE
ncbi:MAG: KH domain-containing protein, partial [Myxococcota bacterium]